MKFGAPSQLKRIGIAAFLETSIEEAVIPNSVLEVADKCFFDCRSLCHVALGSPPPVVGNMAFYGTRSAIPTVTRTAGARNTPKIIRVRLKHINTKL